MDVITTFLINNKEWLFSGAGIVFITLIYHIIFKKRQAEPTQTTQAGERSTIVQSGRDVIINIVPQIKRNDVEEGKSDFLLRDDTFTNIIARGGVITAQNWNVPSEFIDEKINELVELIRKTRFFNELDYISESLSLGERIVEGDLSVGSGQVRSFGLAWCARVLSRSDNIDTAEEFLKRTKSYEGNTEVSIAKAFVLSQKGGKSSALQILAAIDSAESRSASLMVVAHHDGAEGALQWMTDTGYTTNNLNSDGKSSLLSFQLQQGLWNDAAQSVDNLTETDYEQTPVLHHLSALAILVSTVPPEFRSVLLSQVPFELGTFPLASDVGSMMKRREARVQFLSAAEAASHLNCRRAASVGDEYALWLELRDPTLRQHGKNRLEDKLRDLSAALGFVHYALRFDIELDLDAVEREIDRNIAINGGMTLEAAVARFAIAFTKPTAEEAANYIFSHQEQLASHVDPKLMYFRQVELYSQAGLVERANAVLDHLIEKGISDDEEQNLRRIVSVAQGSDPVASRKAQYESTGDLGDLINLVTELEQRQYWNDLCEFGGRLFKQTHSLADAERLADAFDNSHKPKALIKFLQSNSDLLEQSEHLKMSYAWALYNEGTLLEARQKLTELSDQANSQNYRALQINLGIAMGDWNSLLVYIANEYQNRQYRTANDLMRTAQLALHIGSPHAKDLVFDAASKAEDDAELLAAAYFTATKAGWEADSEVFQWLVRAAEISDDDGPLQRMSFKEILDKKPEWDHRESEIWQMLAQGEIPIFMAAQSLNRTLIDLTTFPALANLSEIDPRRRSAIPAYSGKRIPQKVDVSAKTVALDASALLTLSFLNILDVALDAFGTVFIPHSTLGWLFEERQRTAFHQPSRIADARQVRDMLATGKLERFSLSTAANSELSNQVGDELAALIAEAEMVREGDDTQHVVVRSAPVHRLSSLMEEEADLSAHGPVLVSCLAVVEKLKQKGQITADEERKAHAYLLLQERAWPNQPEITDGAVLYLDDLAITYLQHLGLLGKLKDAELKAVASPREVSEIDALITYDCTSDEVKNVIERIRSTLNTRIESGQIKVGGRHKLDTEDDDPISEHPTVGIIALAPDCDVAIVDDRYINQHAHIDFGGTKAPLLSTLDLLDFLEAASLISSEDLLEHRTRLRRAGYFFVPVNADELAQCIDASAVVEGKVVETAELKAIRESVLRIRMSDWLQLPNEAPWLDLTLKAFVKVLGDLWQDSANSDYVIARSNWLSDQVDVRGWAHSFNPENADDVVRVGRGAFILPLLTPPPNVSPSIVDAHWSWVENRILAPVKEQFPDLYTWLVNWYRNEVRSLAETDIPRD